jgi:hypothetical protein
VTYDSPRIPINATGSKKTPYDRGRRREAAAPEVHDDGDDVHRAHPDHVGHRHWLRRVEADRCAPGWRHLHELVVYPAIYEIWKWHFEMKRARTEQQPAALAALPSPEPAP